MQLEMNQTLSYHIFNQVRHETEKTLVMEAFPLNLQMHVNFRNEPQFLQTTSEVMLVVDEALYFLRW